MCKLRGQFQNAVQPYLTHNQKMPAPGILVLSEDYPRGIKCFQKMAQTCGDATTAWVEHLSNHHFK